MIQVTKELRTETGHRLTDYDGRCSHLHGHSYLWQVTISARELSDNGMVADFKDLKKAMYDVLDPLDHCLVLSQEDPLCQLHDGLRRIFRATNNEDPRLIVMSFNPTAENFAVFAAERIQQWFDNRVSGQVGESGMIRVTKVKVWETATSFAEWNEGARLS